ncbi:glycosyltransferase family 2 protein [Pedobacter heparinus]|uniref:glycosyltransferase family 2 protein n=1 Tax=Pedobacter heparinus TaxID=984 RepID=UPI0029319D83|nr:glycosyltransferase family 2 protein [Pedobacter heparinus]
MPKVSVIIPNYNHAAFLVQRIESVVNQSFQDFEVILMDDCSTDHSKTIIEQYRSHPKVSLIVYNEENTGSTFKQWEKGISLSKGEYIWIAESDDWCELNLLEYLVDGIEKDENCVISYCQSYCVQDENKINWVSHDHYLSEITDGNAFMKNRMLLHNPIYNASMVLWKRDFFPKISPEFKNYKLCGDWFFWMDLCRQGKVHISGRLLNYFRKHENDVSGKAMKSGLIYVEALKIINSFFQRGLISKKDYNKAFKMHFKAYYPLKSSLDPQLVKQTEHLFKTALTSKTLYYKLFISAYWKKIKSAKKNK